MLTVFTSTFCRPDLVDLVSKAVKKTASEPVRFVAHIQKDGLEREWAAVDDVIRTEASGYMAWKSATPPAPWLFMHDDCVPVLPWSQASFPVPYCTRNDGGTTLVYRSDSGRLRLAAPLLAAGRVCDVGDCPPAWGELKEIAASCCVESLLGGTFLHIDKSTIAHPGSPANSGKRQLVEAISGFLGITPPAPLTSDELARHPGRTDWPRAMEGDLRRSPSVIAKARNFAAAAAQHVAAGMPQCSDEERERRFAICQQCEHYDGSACSKCGCPIVRQKAYISKLSWADQECPVGKWGKSEAIKQP